MSARILVVDDATTVRLYHRKLLGDAGWTVDEARNGVEALERIAADGAPAAYDLYVVDVNMPRMDGLRFVRELRRLDPAGAAPVLMVSTESARHDMEAAQAVGANAYLVKPAAPAALVSTVALLLGDPATARAALAKEAQ